MTVGFAPKKVIPPQVCRLKVLAADKAEDYGLQIGQKLKVVGGEHDGHTFTDYANRDEVTGRIKVEFGTIGPVPSEEKNSAPEPDGSDDEDMFSNLPL